MVINIRGLTRLLSLPLIREKIPPMRTAIENTLDNSPLSHPNSSVSGLMKTPKPNRAMAFIDITKKLAATTIQP
jgi:hypothetical protein